MIDWADLFTPDIPLLETFIRGTVVYFALLVLMRINKRGAGEIGLSDMLVVVLLADAIQNGMAGEYNSITNGITLVATILFWDYTVDLLAYKIPFLERFLTSSKISLIQNGRYNRRNMRHSMITEDEVMEQLRLNGIDSISQVKSACMESNGKISVIKFKD